MPQNKKREHSFDAMIEFFIQKYNLATKQDINHIARKVDVLEKVLSKMSGAKKPVSSPARGNVRPLPRSY